MGFTPRDVDLMTLWELSACAAGYAKANGVEQEAEAPTYEEHLEMVRRLASPS
ncbi:hypothetical protein [Aquamicrobium sp. LC103]|uniref:hypothetical protein n=1 Tax=Aquamicrobium sp. LC103 TaxID=1120658 RepID=UPI001484F28E|nr:hypothetical protein [Aquamicrobium sp. LC103]